MTCYFSFWYLKVIIRERENAFGYIKSNLNLFFVAQLETSPYQNLSQLFYFLLLSRYGSLLIERPIHRFESMDPFRLLKHLTHRWCQVFRVAVVSFTYDEVCARFVEEYSRILLNIFRFEEAVVNKSGFSLLEKNCPALSAWAVLYLVRAMRILERELYDP